MKYFVSLLLMFFLLTSCVFTETIEITKEGSGKYTFAMDGSSLMTMIPKDSLALGKEIDSVLTFKQLLEEKKDSISKLSSKEQAELKNIENFSMRFKMNEKEKQFLFSLETSFKSVTDLQGLIDNMESIQRFRKSSKNQKMRFMADPSFFKGTSVKMECFYDGKKFLRKTILDQEVLRKMNIDSLSQYKMILEASRYIVNYHFPKPVKTISNKSVIFSNDRKIATVEFSFQEILKSPECLNLQVQFK
ncbi:hypothetical protein V3470_09510 [Flavobacterium oreochromis]|uniref:hypothetical protein n=1 Tax=Flavobacterium oreochromis TaxID=2906078 RepID=UPI0013F5C0EC